VKNGEFWFNTEMMKNKKRALMVIIQKYIYKWMARSTYLKLLPVITFIQSCWQQVQAKKEPLTN
jgi:hypothetical protein